MSDESETNHATTSDNTNSRCDEVILRDLQSLLRKKMGKEMIVVDCVTENLLPKGENYASTMLKVEAKIKRTEDSPEEELHLVAKAIPPTETQRAMLDTAVSVSKELFVIEKLALVFKELERSAGVDEDRLINVWPKSYGGRLTLNDEKPDEADDDAVLLMENLKEQGYDTMSRIHGLDFEHAKLAIRELARFHALGMAVRLKRPDFFKEIQRICNLLPIKISESTLTQWEGANEYIMKNLCEDSRIAKYEDRIRTSFNDSKDWIGLMKLQPAEQWISISHGDFWVNNIMFHHDQSSRADDIRFVDFQLTRTSSPMKDIPYFICTSVSPAVIDNHFNELLDHYYESLIQKLRLLDHDTSLLTRENFDKQLKEDAKTELPRCILALKIFTVEIDPDELDLEDFRSSMMTQGSNNFIERSWRIISIFAEKGWL